MIGVKMKTMKIFAAIILIALIVDIIIPFLLALPYSSYNHKTMVMSVLGSKASPLRHLYNAWTIISGCIFILFGYVIYKFYGNSHKGLCIAIWVLLALYGLGCEIISGFFPVNENTNEQNFSSIIHGIGSVIGFMALLFVPLLLGITQIKIKDNLFGIISVISFVFCIIFFAFFIMGDKPTFQNTALSFTGLWQRVSMYMMYLPLITFIINLLSKESL